MNKQRVTSLRTTLTLLAISVTALAVGLSVLLLALSGILQRSTTIITEAMESVLIAEAAEVDLFLHASAESEIARGHFGEGLLRKIDVAGRHVSTPHEAQLHAVVASSARDYLAASEHAGPTEAPHAAAYQALEALSSINLDQAHDARRWVATWQRIAQTVAVAVAVLLILIAGVVIVWVRRRAFQPVFSLADVMQRFARGERDARADEVGPVELKLMSERFNEMADALAAQRQAQTAFLGGVAHDLRTPIGALRYALSAIGEFDPSPGSRRPLEIANRQISLLDRMVADFLDSAKIDAGELELRCEVIDTRSLVTEFVELMRGSSDKHELVVTLPGDRVPVSCDPLRVEQVLSNLVSNAIKYSPRGGKILISLDVTCDHATLRVTDPGIGISDEDQQRLFEPFRRVGLSQGTIPGMGLGLFIVRRIVEAHAGRIEVTSTPGKGSTFSMVLPLATAADAGIRRGQAAQASLDVAGTN